MQELQLGLYAMVFARTEAEKAAKELNDLLCRGTESDILAREKYWKNKLNCNPPLKKGGLHREFWMVSIPTFHSVN